MAYYMEKDVRINLRKRTKRNIFSWLTFHGVLFFFFLSRRWKFCLCSRAKISLSLMLEARSCRWRTSWCIMWTRKPQLSPCRTCLAGSLLSSWWWCWLWLLAYWSWWVHGRFALCWCRFSFSWLGSCLLFLRSSSSGSETRSGTTKLRWVWSVCRVVSTAKVGFPDNKTLLLSNSKERWRPCKVFLAGVSMDTTTEWTA